MSGTLETASTGRSKCRACGRQIAKGELRLGERLPNVFADGEMTLWFHVECGAFRRPEAFLEACPQTTVGPGVESGDKEAADWSELRALAAVALEHPRMQRIAAVHRAPTGRARCRHCRDPITKGHWRIVLQYFEDARFTPSGFVHPGCLLPYTGSPESRNAVRRVGADCEAGELAELLNELSTTPGDAQG